MNGISTSADGGVTTITLNRPDKLNALDERSVAEIRSAVGQAGTDVLVVAAKGSHFCAGGDLTSIGPLAESRERYAAFLDEWHGMLDDLETHPAPVIAAVQGDAMAGGLELLLACDLVVLDPRARLSDLHVRAGFYPAGGSTLRLPHIVGRRVALWMLLTGEAVDAERALQIGLATEVVEEGMALERASQLARRLASNPPALNGRIKAVVSRSLAEGIAATSAFDRHAALDHMTSPTARAQIRAFLAREPRKTGDEQ